MAGLQALLFLCCLIFHAYGQTKFPALQVLRNQFASDPHRHESAVKDLINRIVPGHGPKFDVSINLYDGDSDYYRVDDTHIQGLNKILIEATSGPAAAAGFGAYLRQRVGAHFSWSGSQVKLPSLLPSVGDRITATSVGKLKYFSNICTFGYSFVYWGWDEWEPFIDWLALNGYNLVLADVATEAIWQNVYRKIGLNQTEIDDFFSAPPFLAWQRMDNFKRYGGPLSQNWHKKQIALQQQIIQRMTDLGITPVLSGFAGHVPDALPNHFPNHTFQRVPCWGFQAPYSCFYGLDPNDELFVHIGSMFYAEAKSMFGLYHAYNTDAFNEMAPKSWDASFLTAYAKAMYQAMINVDKDAIWVKQGWFFVANAKWWMTSAGKTFLTAVPNGRMLLLDLDAYTSPIYPLTKSFYGQPFIWSIVHDYGGKLGLEGPLETMNHGLEKAMQFTGNTLVGTGLMMEGIFQNYVVYQLNSDRAWSSNDLDLKNWIISYASNRYGGITESLKFAWWNLLYTAYGIHSLKHPKPMSSHLVGDVNELDGLFYRPNLKFKMDLKYPPQMLCKIWLNFTKDAGKFNDSFLFKQDLVDVTREALGLIASVQAKAMIDSYNKKDMNGLQAATSALSSIFDDLETTLATHSHFLLGRWIKQAKAKATNPQEENQYEWTFRNQLTQWGPYPGITDYAQKQWTDITKNYYKKRWETFGSYLLKILQTKQPFNQNSFTTLVHNNVETPFIAIRNDEPNKPVGDAVTITTQMVKKYIATCMNIHL